MRRSSNSSSGSNSSFNRVGGVGGRDGRQQATASQISRPIRRAYPSVSTQRGGSGSIAATNSSGTIDSKVAGVRRGSSSSNSGGSSSINNFETASLPLRARVTIGAPRPPSLSR